MPVVSDQGTVPSNNMPSDNMPSKEVPSDAVPPSLLLISDDAEQAQTLTDWLSLAPWVVSWRTSLDGALADPERLDCSLVVLCIESADPERSKLLRRALARFPECAIVTISDDGHDDFVVSDAIEAGVQECLAARGLTQSALSRALRLAEARSRSHRRVAETSTELYHANQELSDFAHVLAHDMRAPVRLSMLLADRLVAAEVGSPQAFDIGDRLTEQLRHQERMLASLLDYVSLKTELPLAAEFDLIPVVDSVVKEMTLYFGLDYRAIRVVGPVSASIQASEIHLGRVVQQLVTNAIVHHPDPKGAVLEIRVEEVGSLCRLTVADNGRGVPSHCREQVFRPLERLTTDAEGVGLGLSICRRIVEAYNGSIKLIPPGHFGTVMAIELPSAQRPAVW